MDRSSVWPKIALALTLAIAVLPALGSKPSSSAPSIWSKAPTSIPTSQSKGKKVAVVCRPLVTLQYPQCHGHPRSGSASHNAAPATGAQDQNREPT